MARPAQNIAAAPFAAGVELRDLLPTCRVALGSARDATDAQLVFDWVCAIRRAKLPDPAKWGNAGSFFKNPVVDAGTHQAMVSSEPEIVSFAQPDGTFKLSAGWMIEACGWKGRQLGRVGVYERQALVLINHGGATAAEVLALATAIQDSVRKRFGVSLEMEPRQF